MTALLKQQAAHEHSMLAADNTSLRSELARAQTDLAFLSGAIKEMSNHSGRISRTRLHEAMRICSKVEAGGDGFHVTPLDTLPEHPEEGGAGVGSGSGASSGRSRRRLRSQHMPRSASARVMH